MVPEDYRFLREEELRRAVVFMPPGGRVLELGAGSGCQARMLSSMGYEVAAIDLEGSSAGPGQLWPVSVYDGKHIPFPDGYFDVVFSSNVLEHIPHVAAFQSEIWRVLKPDGVAVHLLPTSAWCFWSIITYYLHLAGLVLSKFLPRAKACRTDVPGALSGGGPVVSAQKSYAVKFAEMLLLHRHGERGNTLTELYYFRAFWWTGLFRKTGWEIRRRSGNGIFYTGSLLLGRTFNLQARMRVSAILGSSCHLFVLSKPIRSVR